MAVSVVTGIGGCTKDLWLKRGGGTGGTIILKGAATKFITVDESDFIID